MQLDLDGLTMYSLHYLCIFDRYHTSKIVEYFSNQLYRRLKSRAGLTQQCLCLFRYITENPQFRCGHHLYQDVLYLPASANVPAWIMQWSSFHVKFKDCLSLSCSARSSTLAFSYYRSIESKDSNKITPNQSFNLGRMTREQKQP